MLSAACAKIVTDSDGEREFSDNPMLFQTYSATSRAGVITGTTLPENTSFGVFAYLQKGVVGSSTAHWSDGGWKPDFMFNQEVSFDGTDYSYSPLQFWPYNEENTISFWAYYPYEAYTAGNTGELKFYETTDAGSPDFSKNSTTGLPVIKYSVPTDPAQQTDILFDSFANKDQTYEGCTPTPGTVRLQFRHALSLVEFRIVSSGESLPEGATVNIVNMTLTNVADSGVCPDPSASIADTTAAKSFWSPVSGNKTIEISSSFNSSFMMMPQTLSEEGSTGHSVMKLTLSYDIVFPAADNPETTLSYDGNNFEAYIWRSTGTAYGVKRWLPGRKYVYNIEAGLEKIEFSEVTEMSWTSEWPE